MSSNEASCNSQSVKNNKKEKSDSDNTVKEMNDSNQHTIVEQNEDPKIEVVKNHKIRVDKIVKAAYKSWRLPSYVLRKVNNIEIELMWNSKVMFDAVKHTSLSETMDFDKFKENNCSLYKQRYEKSFHEDSMYRGWIQFCRLHNFNDNKPHYFYYSPLTKRYYSNLFLTYFAYFLTGTTIKKTQPVLITFERLFEGDRDIEPFSNYDDAVILALHKRLKSQYVNYIACATINRSYKGVCKRYIKLTTTKKKKNRFQYSSSSLSEIDE